MAIFQQHTPGLAHYDLWPIANNALQLQPARRHKESVIVGVTAQKIFLKSIGIHDWTMMMMMMNYPNDTHIDGV